MGPCCTGTIRIITIMQSRSHLLLCQINGLLSFSDFFNHHTSDTSVASSCGNNKTCTDNFLPPPYLHPIHCKTASWKFYVTTSHMNSDWTPSQTPHPVVPVAARVNSNEPKTINQQTQYIKNTWTKSEHQPNSSQNNYTSPKHPTVPWAFATSCWMKSEGFLY